MTLPTGFDDHDWPDLTDTSRFPPVAGTIAHAPVLGTSSALVRSCYPAGRVLTPVLPFQHATERAALVQRNRTGAHTIIPIPPSVAVQCSSFDADATIETSYNDAAQIIRDVTYAGGDSCLPRLRDTITVPCTTHQITPQISMSKGGGATFTATTQNDASGKSCHSSTTLQLRVPIICTELAVQTVAQVDSTLTAPQLTAVLSETGGGSGCGKMIQLTLKLPDYASSSNTSIKIGTVVDGNALCTRGTQNVCGIKPYTGTNISGENPSNPNGASSTACSYTSGVDGIGRVKVGTDYFLAYNTTKRSYATDRPCVLANPVTVSNGLKVYQLGITAWE